MNMVTRVGGIVQTEVQSVDVGGSVSLQWALRF